MADNNPDITSNTVDDQKQRSKQDYNKAVDPSARDNNVGNARDLGSVGGGTVPGLDSSAGSGNPPGGMSTSDSTMESGGTTGHTNPGGGATVDRGKETHMDMAGGTRGNSIDRAPGTVFFLHP